MSKSLGNVLSIPAVLHRVRAAELRYYLGSAHYRSMLEFSETALQDAVKAYAGIEDFLHRVRNRVGAVVPGEWTPKFAAALGRRPAGADGAGRGARRPRGGQPGTGRRATTRRRWCRPRSIRAMMGDPRAAIRSTSGGCPATRRPRRWPPSTCWCRPRSQPPRGAAERPDWAQADADPRPAQAGRGIEVTDTADGPQWSLLRGEHEVHMAGNSQRRGAVRKDGTKKGPVVGSGGVRRRGPGGQGRHAARAPSGPTTRPPSVRRRPPSSSAAQRARKTDETEMVLGRNPVVECLRAGVPATALYVALGAEADERMTEAVTRAADSGIAILEVPRLDLDRMSTNGLHQGIALQVPPYHYAHPDDMLGVGDEATVSPALLVALDNISDPRNLGAIVRSVAAFGGHGVVIPQRRSASVTAVAWRTSCAARRPGCRWRGLRISNRTLKNWADAGLQVVGLDADGDTTLDELDGTARWSWWSVRRARGCRGWCGRTADAGRVDSDGWAHRVAERLGGRRRGAGRNRPAAKELASSVWSRGDVRHRTGGFPSHRPSTDNDQRGGTVNKPIRLNSAKPAGEAASR